LSFDPVLQAQAYPEKAKRNIADAKPDHKVKGANDPDRRPTRPPPPTAMGSGEMEKNARHREDGGHSNPGRAGNRMECGMAQAARLSA
jgi:hypothetical protein